MVERALPLARPRAAGPSPRTLAAVGVMLALALVPVLAQALGQPTWLTLFTRVMAYALAAVGLNLVLGHGAMVSLGHAMYLGIGAYAVGILGAGGVDSAGLQLMAALGVGLAVAVPVGLVCLRTSGIAFIMITLAFAQMLYFLVVGLKQYGGDDGLPLAHRSTLGPLDLEDDRVLYYLAFTVLALVLYGLRRLIAARFGLVLRGSRANPRRMLALGFPTLRYRLAAYVLSALVCVVAGMLLANLTRFVSPATMQWSVSGELIAMAVLGGLSTLVGPVVGAAAWLLIEEVLGSANFGLPWGLDEALHDHWFLVLGTLVVVATLTLEHGLFGWIKAREST